MTRMNTITLLNTDFDNTTADLLLHDRTYRFIVPVNVDVLITLQRNERLYHYLREYRSQTKIVLDSQVLRLLASLFLRRHFQEVIIGADFMQQLYKTQCKSSTSKFFLLGGAGNNAEVASKTINKKVGFDLVVDHFSPPYGFENDRQKCLSIVDRVNTSGANVLIVGLGCPKQECFIYSYCELMPGIHQFIAVGAAIDYEAGAKKRAPLVFRKCACEWLYRLVQEPKRLAHRYLITDMAIFGYLAKQKFGFYKNPFSIEE
jgi:N-acetylglucosaminyldiphosphoundecaprenol N-acetyl-beta-D-mannosaminyltransferase